MSITIGSGYSPLCTAPVNKPAGKHGADKEKETKLLERLRETYKDYNIQVGVEGMEFDETYDESKSVTVIIHPDELKRMANDSQYSEKIEGVLSGLPDLAERFKEQLAARGSEYVGFELVIGKSGAVGAWLYGKPAGADSQDDSDLFIRKFDDIAALMAASHGKLDAGV